MVIPRMFATSSRRPSGVPCVLLLTLNIMKCEGPTGIHRTHREHALSIEGALGHRVQPRSATARSVRSISENGPQVWSQHGFGCLRPEAGGCRRPHAHVLAERDGTCHASVV